MTSNETTLLPDEPDTPVLTETDESMPMPAVSAENAPDPDEAKRIIEACLFAAGHPLHFTRLAELLCMTPGEVRALVSSMTDDYATRGIQLLILENECQLATREAYREYIRAALGIRRGGNLSKSSLETIAIIAYNQPVTRGYVDEVRGVDSSYAVNALLEKGLIEAKGRLDVPGRPILYGTTATFLMVFGLSSLSQLPPADLFLNSEAPEQLTLPIEKGTEPEAVAESDTPATGAPTAQDGTEAQVPDASQAPAPADD